MVSLHGKSTATPSADATPAVERTRSHATSRSVLKLITSCSSFRVVRIRFLPGFQRSKILQFSLKSCLANAQSCVQSTQQRHNRERVMSVNSPGTRVVLLLLASISTLCVVKKKKVAVSVSSPRLVTSPPARGCLRPLRSPCFSHHS